MPVLTIDAAVESWPIAGAFIIARGANKPEALRNMRPGCRGHIETHFTYARQAQACVALYEDLLKRAKTFSPKPDQSFSTRAMNDPGPHLQRVFAPLLKHVFDLDPELPAAAGDLAASEIETMRRAGARVLAVEAGRTIILDQADTIALADRYGLTLVALGSAAGLLGYWRRRKAARLDGESLPAPEEAPAA